MKKRYFSLFLAVTLIIVQLPILGFSIVGEAAAYDNDLLLATATDVNDLGYIAVNSNNFPDSTFRSIISSDYDLDGDGYLSDTEISKATVMDIQFQFISNLSGIEYFTELKELNCSTNWLSSLDLRKNTKLEKLDCSDNSISSLDLSGNTELVSLYCGNNFLLRSINLNNNIYLEYFDCKWCSFTTLDLSNCSKLKYLNCEWNDLKSLDISNNPELEKLYCSMNSITYLNINNNKKLSVLDCDYVNVDFRLFRPQIKQTALLSNGIGVSWDKVPGATGYYLYRKVDGGKWTRIADSANFDIIDWGYLYYNDYNVVSGKTYYYTIIAYNDYCITGYDTVGKGLKYISTPILNTPTNLSNGIKVSWDKVNGAEGYYVFRRIGGGAWQNIAKITNGSQNYYIDTAAANGVLYNYTVRAFTSTHISSYNSNGVWCKRLNQPALYAPTNVSSGVKVSWTKSTGAQGYYVFRRTTGGTWRCVGKVTNGNTLSFIDTTAVSGTVYAYTVRAYYGSYISSYNTTGRGAYYLKAPTASVSAVKGKNTIKWTRTAGAKGYYLYRKTATGSWVLVKNITNNSIVSYTDTSIKSGTKYYYTVRAYYGSYNSAFSNIPGITAK